MAAVHDTLVAKQFGTHASAYATSAVHAAGDDLLQIAALAKAHNVKRALDLGCGAGHVSFHLAPCAGDVTAYDLSPDMLAVVADGARARGLSNIRTRQGRAEQLPFATATFDFVATRFSVHHWHDFKAGLAEARRVLAPRGHAVFVDTVSPESPLLDTRLQAIELLRDPSHVRNYSVTEWTAALTAAGFVPGAPTIRRLRLDFASWITRLATPDVHVRAIQALMATLSQEAREHFAIEADGSFTIDAMTLEAAPAPG